MKSDALSQLRDIHLPEPISWWPLALGWWLLLVLCSLLGVACWYAWQRHKSTTRNPTRKVLLAAALRELDQVDAALQSSDPTAVASLSVLMRRFAMQLDAGVAGLSGTGWLHWLDSHWQRDDFISGAGRGLIDAPYRPVSEAQVNKLFRICRQWLEAQR